MPACHSVTAVSFCIFNNLHSRGTMAVHKTANKSETASQRKWQITT